MASLVKGFRNRAARPFQMVSKGRSKDEKQSTDIPCTQEDFEKLYSIDGVMSEPLGMEAAPWRDFRRSSEPGPGCRPTLSTRALRNTVEHYAAPLASSRAGISRVPRLSKGNAGNIFGCERSGSSVLEAEAAERNAAEARDGSCSALSDITNVVPSSRVHAASKPPPLAPARTEGRKPPSLPPPTAVGDVPPSTGGNDACTSSPQRRSARESADGSPFRADSEGVQAVAEYVPDVVNRLFKEELAYVPRIGFMDSHVDINCKMRAILVDWLVEVHQKYHLRPVTLFLTINIIDRYLAVAQVPRKRLQLVGVVALNIAAKFEEIQPPRVADYVYITDNAYTKSDVMNLECVMLTKLGFRIAVPSVSQFLECFQRANRCDNVHRKVSWYLVELALMDPRLTSQPPSLLAAASVFLSNELVGRTPCWPVGLVRHARRTEAELRSCVAELRSILAAAPSHSLQAIRRKYTSQANHAVARIVSVPATT